MRRRVAAAIALLLVAGAAPVDVLGSTDGAGAAITTGWWSRLHQGEVDLAVADPGGAPPEALTVASAPDGATAITALRLVLDDGEGSPVLTLQVAGTPVNGDGAETVILACHAGAAWTAGAAQDWDSKPPAACDAATGGGSITGQRSDDGASWVFPLGALQLDRVLDVVLVPARMPDAPVSPTFQVRFEAPGPNALSTRSTAAAPLVTLPPPTSGPAVASRPPLPASAPPVAGTFTAALPPSDRVVTATAPIRREATPLQAIADLTGRRTPGWVRALALLQALAAAGIALLLLRTRGDDMNDDRRGLGPFVRTRIGEAPRL